MANTDFTTEELANEEWRPVVGYEGVYSVSDLGRVRRDLAVPGATPGRILRRIAVKGYQHVYLYTFGIRRRWQIHRLAIEAFIGARPIGLQVNHKDGLKTNNRPNNLEYVTAKENKQHASRLGLVAKGPRKPEHILRGERHWSRHHPDRISKGSQLNRSCLTDDSVRLIRQLAANGMGYKDIGNQYSVTPQAIYCIVKRKTWKHVD